MARLHCSKGNYYARFTDKTRTPERRAVPLKTRDEAAARAAIRRLEVHYAEGRFDPWAPPEAPPARLSEAVDAFYRAKTHRAPATLRLYRTVLDGLLAHAGDRPVRDLAPRDVLAFLGSRELGEVGREAYFVRIKVFARWCLRAGLVEHVVTDRVDVPRGPDVFPHWLTRSEFDRLVASIRSAADVAHDGEVSWLIPFVTVAAITGLRLGELVALRWRDVDLERGRLLVRNTAEARTKSRRDRVIPVAGAAARAFREVGPGPGDALVFTGAGGGPVNREYASKSFLRYRRAAGLPDEIHFHSLRHTYASWLVQGGVALVRVKEVLGHASLATTLRYAHLAPDSAFDEVARALG
ncbi:MAG TPA: site-specific integrase [Rubricoccaceae bacterium]|jgi:integrase